MEFFELKIWGNLLEASLVSLQLFIVVLLISIPLGIIVNLGRKVPFLKYIISIYINIMRGTPLMLQLFFIFYGVYHIPVIGPYISIKDRFIAACFTYIINYAAYFAEIFRGGYMSIPKGQYDAAQVLGYSKFQCQVKIIIPQVLKVVLPMIANESITLIKDTSLMFTVGIVELMGQAKTMVNDLVSITPFIITGIIYFAFSWILVKIFTFFESKLKFER